MIPFRDLPINRKLMRMNMIVSASVLLLSCGAFIGYELFTFKQNAAEHLATDAEIVGIDVTSALLFNDPDAAAQSLTALRAMPNILSSAVYRTDGRVFAKYVRGSGNVAALPETLKTTRSTYRIEGGCFIVLQQIVSDGKPIGMVYIQSDLEGIAQRLRSYALIVFGVLAACFAVAVAVSSMLERKISGPILSLAETTKMIAAKRDYSLRAAVQSKDETGILGEAFNDMLRQIEERNDTLQDSERHFRELADAMPQIVWTANAEGEREYVNQRWFDYTGTTPKQSGPGGLVELIHPDDVGFVEAWAGSVRSGTPFFAEYRIRRASDGADRWHLCRALPVRDKHGQIIRWLGTATDIDDRKRAEAEVREINAELEQRVAERTERLTAANEELAQANQAKDRFLATMSHELRTPLNAILGFTGTLLMKLAGPLTAAQESQLQTVRDSARHLLSLINDILDVAKIESGKIVLRLEPVSCQGVLNEVAAALRPLAAVKGLQFEVVAPDEELIVPTDRRALSQIVINLANNAIKFTEKGFVRLELQRRESGQSGNCELSVTDSGIGIGEEDRQKLFRPFEQIYGKSNRHTEGTGLGLYLSQKLASLLGGEIVCQSTFGSGSRFSLVL